MNNGKLRIVGCLIGLAGVLLSGSAFAQDAPEAAAPAAPPEPAPAPAPAPATADASASTGGSAEVGMALPGAAPQAAAVAGTSDHDSVVGRLAVGYLGRQDVPAFAPLAGANAVTAPVIGVRYWLSDMLGIDAGIGFGLTSGSQEAPPAASTDDPSFYAFLLHGGVPLSLASAGHFSFLIVPELNIGFAGSSTEVMGVDSSASAFHLDVGARAGAEIHFGFIDVPQLSLQAGVGLRLDMDSASSEGNGMDGPSSSNFAIRTTTNGEPWAIFTNSISAFYYF